MKTKSRDTPSTPESATGTRRVGAAFSRPALWCTVLIVSLLFFLVTSPQSVPSLLLILGFVMLGAFLLSAVQLLFMVTGLRSKLTTLQRRCVLLTATILPVLLVMMQSIGQLTVRDVLTLAGLFLIGVFYITRAR